jgi:predicted double-glycine peptidase
MSFAIPIVRQTESFSCGAAALTACLYYWQVFDGSEPEIQSACDTTKTKGTVPNNIVKVAKKYGLKAKLVLGYDFEKLEDLINKESHITVILNYQAWSENGKKEYSKDFKNGHYGVLVDIDDSDIILMDPSIPDSYGKLSIADFKSRWHDKTADGQKVKHLAIIISGDYGTGEFPARPKNIK